MSPIDRFSLTAALIVGLMNTIEIILLFVVLRRILKGLGK